MYVCMYVYKYIIEYANFGCLPKIVIVIELHDVFTSHVPKGISFIAMMIFALDYL